MSNFIPPFIPQMPSVASAGGQADQIQQDQDKPHGHKGHGGGGKAAKGAHHGGQRLQQKLVLQMKAGPQQNAAPGQAQGSQKQTGIRLNADGSAGGASASTAEGLHAAIREQDKARFDRLIAAGAELDARDADGETPLALASRMLDAARRQAPDAAGLAAYFVAVLQARGATLD